MWKMRVETAEYNISKTFNTKHVITKRPKLRRLCLHSYEYWKAVVTETIDNRGDWFGSSANIRGANKDAKI